MNEKLRDTWEKVKSSKAKEQYDKMSPKTKKFLFLGLAVALVVSIAAAVMLNNKPYETLFTGLNEQEASEIIGKLQEYGTTYKYENGGTILVPKAEEPKLKAQLVYEGYPKSGFTYDVFKNNIDMTTTESERESYKLFDLQERMGATISLIPGVQDAKVTIALGQDNRYVLNTSDESKTTASVVLVMDNGATPTEKQVQGIQRLVSKSIPKLAFEDVVVLDSNGVDVSVSSKESQSQSTQLKMQVEKAVEDNVKAKVLHVLEPVYGDGHVRVSVKSDVDIDKKIREIVNYTADTQDNKGVLGKELTSQEIMKNGNPTGGIPGTETNAENPGATVPALDGTETYFKNDNEMNYLVDQLKEQAQIDSGIVNDLTVSVIVDGQDYGALSKRDLVSLIAKAAGIPADAQGDKIEVMSAPFYHPEDDTQKSLLDGGNVVVIGGIAAGGILLLVIIITVLIMSSKKKKKKAQLALEAEQAAAAEAAAAAAAAAGILGPLPTAEGIDGTQMHYDLMDIKNERGMELKNKIREFAEENPEISAELLKIWLRGGDESGSR